MKAQTATGNSAGAAASSAALSVMPKRRMYGGNWKPFHVAREEARSLRLPSRDAWRVWCVTSAPFSTPLRLRVPKAHACGGAQVREQQAAVGHAYLS
jgi:hypothetical protein